MIVVGTHIPDEQILPVIAYDSNFDKGVSGEVGNKSFNGIPNFKRLTSVLTKYVVFLSKVVLFTSFLGTFAANMVVNASDAGLEVYDVGECAPYVIHETDLQPFSLLNGSNSAWIDYDISECISVNGTSSLEARISLEKRYWWITLGLAFYKTADTILHWDNIYDECSHFTGSWKNGVNCIWDVLSTFAAYGGWFHQNYAAILKAVSWVGHGGDVIGPWGIFQKKDGMTLEYGFYTVDLSNNLIPVPASINQTLSSLLTTLFEGPHQLLTVSYAAGNETGEVTVANLTHPIHNYSDHTGLLFGYNLNGVNISYHFLSPKQGYTFYNMLPSDWGRHLTKRADEPRYEDEYFASSYGVTSNICHNGDDPGQSNLDGDFVTWRDDLKCHTDIGGHSGVYVQGYDNNAQGTLFSYSAAPYAPGKKNILLGMTVCPGGIGHECGRTN